ncbi:hypothetical protein IE81DRAFT_190273 [Ceraceosorus guamensis]|uniref:Uncharacterized protein n=1 Tax=Ceraceosorus guamensis TaxID=1522189 RepID=A0A316W9H6_9BASI|nr:hypothetical protein IE81DRAFT_190273 [Ceraceosorus guamensis]PWN45411.1 hypothetical protein IE81DRAFT_190273 [Ceraceosorus guamensis]
MDTPLAVPGDGIIGVEDESVKAFLNPSSAQGLATRPLEVDGRVAFMLQVFRRGVQSVSLALLAGFRHALEAAADWVAQGSTADRLGRRRLAPRRQSSRRCNEILKTQNRLSRESRIGS